MKINGVFEIDSEIDPQKDYSIALERISLKYSNIKEQGDEKTTTYVMESLGLATIISAEEVIEAKPTKITPSQYQRIIIEKNFEQSGEEDKEAYYTRQMAKIAEYLINKYKQPCG